MLSIAALALPLSISGEPPGQVSGFYSRQGALSDATAIAPEGPGFVHLFESRDRRYGSQGLIELLERSAAEIARLHPEGERLQIGDIAAIGGGPIRGHASHQNGLDADLVYYRTSHREQSAADGDAGFIETFVTGEGADHADVAGTHASPDLDVARSWELIKLLSASHRLARIFMHPAIKRAFCQEARSRGELQSESRTLSRLRPLDNHDDHMHVRISCPTESPGCVPQPEPDADPGC
jgi:penicillin-insensitive murein endopeptidase